jgi:hypothetical protein
MSEERPTPDDDVLDDVPDDDVPDELVDRIENESPAVLRAIAGYATALAEARVDEEPPRESGEPDAPGEPPEPSSVAVNDVDVGSGGGAGAVEHERAGFDDDGGTTATDSDASLPEDGERPDGVPGKASITVKEINENRYYYWQWRDGDTVKSTYHGPVNSSS